MICRIFNLGKGDETGMHIYLDPETKRRNRELEFSAQTWAVKPLTHPTMPVRNGTGRGSAAPASRMVATTPGTSGDPRSNDAKEGRVIPSSSIIGSSTTDNVPRRSDWTFGSSTPGSQKKTEIPGGSIGSESAPSSNNTSTQPLR